jgi:membrane protein required for colicin V production
MTVFDLAVLGAIGVSALVALVRGFVRSVISLVAWVVALVLALQWGPVVAGVVPPSLMPAPAAQVLGFSLVFLAIVIAGALIGMLLARVLHAVGLGAVDSLLGALFGLGRGLVVVLVGVLLAGLTALPRQDWWQNSRLAEPLVGCVLSLSPYLPEGWAERLDFSASGKRPVPGTPAESRTQRT